jgi:hypothetical protein
MEIKRTRSLPIQMQDIGNVRLPSDPPGHLFQTVIGRTIVRLTTILFPTIREGVSQKVSDDRPCFCAVSSSSRGASTLN